MSDIPVLTSSKLLMTSESAIMDFKFITTMSVISRVKRLLVGAPIATKHAHHERLSVLFGLPVFAADAISSVAYSCEEILRVLVLGTVNAMPILMPVSYALGALLIIIAFSYYQTIHAYPQGGGTYLVSSENLGSFAGRIAGASLLIDYVLTVAVSISAGAAAIYSAFPTMEPFRVHISFLAILVIMIANLRGARESGMLFAVPVYLFIVTVIVMIAISLFTGAPPDHQTYNKQTWDSYGYPVITQVALSFLVLRAFAASCAALTGTEAIADGVQAFRKPEAKRASMTLILMVILMLTLSIGISWAALHLHIVPMPEKAEGYKTVMAQIGEIYFKNAYVLFYVLQASTAAILFLAANTAFADFPRLTSFIARDKFLPRQLMSVGDRLVFQNGIILLSLLAMALIFIFHAQVHMLIPLYAMGVFISFTLSQAGMTVKWAKISRAAHKSPLWNWRMYVSAIGSLVTLTVTGILLWTKWHEKAYLIAIAIVALLFVFSKIRKYYDYLAREFEVAPEDTVEEIDSTVILLVPRLHRGTVKAIAYAKSLAKDCRALHVTLDKKSADPLREFWKKNSIDIPLVILESEYRSQVEPVTEYVDRAVAEHPNAMITVIVPQGIPPKWYQTILHSNLAIALKLVLGNRRNVVITNVRYFL
jgi:amino acid transporter